MSDPIGNEKDQQSAATNEAKAGSAQIVYGLISVFGSLLGIGFVMWFMSYGEGSIHVPVGAIIAGLVLGVIGLFDGLRRLIWAYRAKGIIVASIVAVILGGLGLWWYEDFSFKEAVKALPVEDFRDSDKVVEYVAKHGWSPYVADLDDQLWRLVVHENYGSRYVSYYIDTFKQKPRHQADVDRLKNNVHAAMRKAPEVAGCRWFIDAFSGPADFSRNNPPEISEACDLLIKAVSKDSSLHTLTPPAAVLQQLFKSGKVTLSVASDDKDADCSGSIEGCVQLCFAEFGLAWPENVGKGGNIRFDCKWQRGSHMAFSKDSDAPSKMVNITESIFTDANGTTPIWTGKATFETPKDLTACVNGDVVNLDMPSSCTIYSSDGIEAQVNKATLQQVILAHPFSYWSERTYKYVPPAP